MHPFSFDHLNETQFEEFCYDLLGEIGFINRSWRKGTGLSSSPSDRGRDIECDRQITDPVGNNYTEKWFVECKHFQKGVPPEKLQGILSWASSERPNHVLIIASHFLSNPAKDYIKNYQTNNNPPFKINTWEKPDLEKLTIGKTILRRKYNIGGDFPFIKILHPIHLLYFRSPPVNSVSYFFDVLDKVDPEKRDKAMDLTYYRVINPRTRKSVTGKEKLYELLIDEVSYAAFKRKCREIVKIFAEDIFVFFLVSHTLKYLFAIGDLTNVDSVVQRHKSDIEYFLSLVRCFDSDRAEDRERLNSFVETAKAKNPTFYEEKLREDIEAIIKNLTESLTEVESRMQSNYLLYEYFCQNVVGELLKEEMHLNL